MVKKAKTMTPAADAPNTNGDSTIPEPKPAGWDGTIDRSEYVEVDLREAIEVDGHRYLPGTHLRVLKSELHKFAPAT